MIFVPYYGNMFQSFLDHLQVNERTNCTFPYVRWPEGALKKTETCCHSKIPIS